MRFSTTWGMLVAVCGVRSAESGYACCLGRLRADFEDLTNVPALGSGIASSPLANSSGNSFLSWANFYSVTPSVGAQFLLPQGKMHVLSVKPQTPHPQPHQGGRDPANTARPLLSFAVAPNSPAATPAVIEATRGHLLKPESIFMGLFVRNPLGGVSALSSPATVTVTGTFSDGNKRSADFRFGPASAVFGQPINAQALQFFPLSCYWDSVVRLEFRPQVQDGDSNAVGLAIDNFQYFVDTFWVDKFYC